MHTLLDTKEELLLEERGGRGGLFQPPLPLDNKTVAHLILRAAPPFRPACISRNNPILVNLFLVRISLSFAEFLLYGGIKNLNLGKSRHQGSESNLHAVGSSPHLGLGWVRVPGTWVQVPVWVLAGFKS